MLRVKYASRVSRNDCQCSIHARQKETSGVRLQTGLAPIGEITQSEPLLGDSPRPFPW